MYCTRGDINVATWKRGRGEAMRCQMPNDGLLFPCVFQNSHQIPIFFHFHSSKISGRLSFLSAVDGARDATCLVLKCRSFHDARTLPESPINSWMRPRDRKAAGLAASRFPVEGNEGAICSSIFAYSYRLPPLRRKFYRRHSARSGRLGARFV